MLAIHNHVLLLFYAYIEDKRFIDLFHAVFSCFRFELINNGIVLQINMSIILAC